mgnify:CR=1 FL=1|jgi:DNA repair photolyase|tara:strand:- start:1429 stop:2484 length:1056 start_codon:yes stop_codon:yes gene_type:complete
MDNKFKYSEEYKFISPGKSWIFVNPNHGCNLGCEYCVEQKDDWFKREVTSIYSVEETIKNLEESPLIIKNKSPLSFFNYSDPFLSENTGKLIEILDYLNSNNWTNKVGLISKIHPGEKTLEKLSKFQNLKMGLFVSYANLNKGLEKASSKKRIQLMKDSHDLGIPTIDYIRPLVREWISKDKIKDLADKINGHVDAVSLSGIRLTPEIINNLEEKSLPTPVARTYLKKQRNNELNKEVIEIIEEVTGVPSFVHTSCAMSYLFNEPDYNSHDIRDKLKEDACRFPCVPSQREICYSRKCDTSNEEIKDILSKLNKKVNFERDNDVILLEGRDLKKEDISFLRHLIPEFVMKK